MVHRGFVNQPVLDEPLCETPQRHAVRTANCRYCVVIHGLRSNPNFTKRLVYSLLSGDQLSNATADTRTRRVTPDVISFPLSALKRPNCAENQRPLGHSF